MLDHSEGSVKPVRLVRLPPPPSLPLTIGRKSGSRTRSVRACQVLRPRRVGPVLALALLDMLPSTTQTVSAPGISFLSRLTSWPARSPADASPTASRMPAHGLGPMWAAIPSSQWTCTTYSLPVSRRTCVKTLKSQQGGELFSLWLYFRSQSQRYCSLE